MFLVISLVCHYQNLGKLSWCYVCLVNSDLDYMVMMSLKTEFANYSDLLMQNSSQLYSVFFEQEIKNLIIQTS